jgi:acyl carrier protein
MKNKLQIKEKIRQFVVTTSYADEKQINDETLIFEEGIMDSMAFMSLISFLDESFSIQPNRDELLEINFESINAITGYVMKNLNID